MTIIEQLAALDKATQFVVSAFEADACAALDTAITELAEARAILPADWEQQLQALERTWSRRCANVIAKAVADVEAAEARVAALTGALGEAEYFAKNIDLFIAVYDGKAFDSGLLEERRIKVLKIIRAALTPKAKA